MLTVAPLASGQAHYYLSLTASAYYTKAHEPEGSWYGLGAEEFGLKGTIKPDDLIKLCEGYDPQDPARHVRNAGQNEGPRARKHGDDLCFSAPKSVSVAWALGSDELREAIQAKLHQAVKDALDHIQDTCGYARVGAKGQQLERVPLTFALFEHSSSRLGDPQLHVHAVCPNLTTHTGKDGKIRVTAIDSTEFYHHQMVGGAPFRASLAEGMQELGFEIERDGFAFRLKGIDEKLCERFSQRRAEIVEGILKRAGGGTKLSDVDAREVLRAARGRTAELVNLETRRGKEEYTREELFPIWQEIALGAGIKQGHVERLRHSPWPFSESQKFLAKADLFRDSIEKLSDEFSHFSEKDLVRRVSEEAQGRGLTAKDVRELIQEKIDRQEVLRLGELVTGRKNHERNSYRERSEARYTTEEILKMEGLMLGSIERMAQKIAPVRSELAEAAIAKTAEKLSKKGHEFTAEQADAVRHLTTGKGLIACMTGKAGSGKSTTLDTCRVAWEMAGREVIGCALAGVAADALRRSSGIKSDTLTRTIMRLEYGRLTLTRNHVVVLDEAGMVATKPMAKLVRHVEEAGAKLVLVGDAAQLQPIGAGGPFRSIAQRVGQCELTQIIRQREEWRRQTVEQFSRGEAREALMAYAAQKQLHVTETRDEALRGLVDRWKADNGIQNTEGRPLARVAQRRSTGH